VAYFLDEERKTMVYTLAALLLFQCLGEAIVFVLGLPIPGAVMGMLLLFFALLSFPSLLEKLEESSHHLLKHMALFFIPAGVGIMVTASGIAQHWFALLVAVVVSTVLSLIVTAVSMQFLMSRQKTSLHPPIAGASELDEVGARLDASEPK
jgi:holin-like protein